jgi:hypothetical protein
MNEDRKIDEAFLAEMMKRGKKAWEDVPDATAWVEDLRTDMTQNKMNDTPTPRTDALMPDQGHKRTIYEHIQVMETHARQLERELADMTKQRDALAEALASLLSGVKDGWFNEGKWWHTGIEQAEQALATTKGGKP